MNQATWRTTVSLLTTFLAATTAEASQIVSFFPTGSVKAVQQVTVRFSSDVMAMGDPRSKADPFTMTCKTPPPAYKTRWADSKTWSLDFAAPLKAGIRCEFKMRAELKDLAGGPVEGLESYSFTTAGPALLNVAPRYSQIEPEQYFVALSDGEMDAKSVEALAYFEAQGIPDKILLKVIQGKDREAAIRSVVANDWELRSYARLLDQKPPKPFAQIMEMENFVVLAGARRFPEGVKVALHWPKGILSKTGLPVEEAQRFEFQVIEPFKAEFNCERAAPGRPCNPILDMRVRFTRAVASSVLKSAKIVYGEGANSKTWTAEEFEKEKSNPGDQLDSLTFKGPFPDSAKLKVILPPGIKDELGRTLTNQKSFPLDTATDEYLPLVKFAAPFGIVELKADAMLPVNLRNIEKQLPGQQFSIEGKTLNLSKAGQAKSILNLYKRVRRKDYNYSARNTPLLEKAQGTAFQFTKPLGERELEVVGIPLKKPGFYVVELASPKLGLALTGVKPMYVASAALVTDMAVHLKKGRESSLVWVTQLSDAKPIGGAKVTVVDGLGRELAKGVTDSQGAWRMKVEDRCKPQYDEETESADNCEWFAFVEKGEDFSFVSSSWSKGIEAYRFNVSREYLQEQWGPVAIHTVFDRMVAQPGETIQMKHILREYHEQGFRQMNPNRLPKRVLVVHQGSQKTYTLPFEFDKATGSAIGKFVIPKEATLGQYAVYLSNTDKMPAQEGDEADPFDWSAQSTGHFVVSEYRLPLMKASVKIQGDPLVRPSEIAADLSAHYLSGGPAKGMKVKVRTGIGPGYFTPDVPGGGDYNFFSRPMKAGIVSSEERLENAESFLKVQELTLSPEGGALAKVPGLPQVNRVQELTLEMEYTDPNGEVKTAAARAPLFPSEYVVGLRSDSWIADPTKTKVMGVVTTNKGKPQKDRPYIVEAFRTNYITHRKRLVGGFYSYDSKTEVIALGKACDGKTDENGRFQCEPKGLPAGQITLQARASDDKGRSTYATTSVTIFEKGKERWWVPSDSDRIDLLPERNRYEPGEKAKLVVRTPYPTSTVLVTVEREGVLDSFVTEIQRDNPTVEIPMKGNYAPNVFVSALVIRGRVGDPKPTALLDLGRPVMKMGLTELKVGWKAHELAVQVKSDKQKYRARDKAQVTVQVKTATGTALPAGSEVALAAIDESLLRLKENTSWKLLSAMMGERGLAVETSSGQNQVIGRRHYGSKAKAPGGGGGLAADPRDLFDPVLLWQPKVKLNAAGEAKVTVPLNDSMTSFRIVAVATAGDSFFGDGSVTVESSKDLILYSGFAPMVREVDQIKNAFTVRNTTQKPMKVSIEVTSKEVPNLPKFSAIELKPSEAKAMELPVTIPLGLKEASFQLKATDSVSGSSDAMIAKVRIEPAVPPQVLQATLFQLDKSYQIPVKQPADAIPGVGGLNVSARSTLVSGLAGVKSYMEAYPYVCLEQKMSKGIVTEDKAEIGRLIEALPSYFDGFGLLKFFPSSDCGSAQLTRYIFNILSENGHAIPAATQSRMVNGIITYLNGQYTCATWWDKIMRDPFVDEGKILLMETLSRAKAFDPKMLSTVQLTPNVWKTETVTAWFRLLKRQADIPGRDGHLKQAENILRSRVNFQGSIMNVQGVLDWTAQWRLFTSRDQEAMGVFGVAIEDPAWSQDAGRMARGIVARLRKGHFDTSMANAWAVTQLRRFSAKFENEKVGGETKIAAAEIASSIQWQQAPNGEKKTLAWPKTSAKSEVPVQFTHVGSGKPWVHLETVSALPLKAPVDFGYTIARKITPVVQAAAGTWTAGDVANVELTVTAKADQPWVVVRDPIPAGASHLGTGLDGSSNLLNRAPKQGATPADVQYWPLEFEEKSQSHYTAYAAYLPRGTYRVSYRIRLNSAGEFKLPPVRAEAMYSPETFGETPSANWKVVR